MKNYFLLFLYFLTSQFTFAQQKRNSLPDKQVINSSTMRAGAFINVNVPPYPASNFSATQLVTDVLIAGGSSCVANPAVSNVVVSPATAPTFANRAWGYFNKGTATFPFDAGIVLSTGFARNAGNVLSTTTFGDESNSNTLNNNSGDADLSAALGVTNSSLKDVSFLEFDFVPTSTQLTFNYIFASEEYTGGFPCSFTDGFALLLKPVGGAYTNLAVLPGGLGAVSVTNIRPSTSYDGGALGCAPQNPTYFAGYNNPITGHNFNGAVIPLTAQATVIPGQAYHIKMVIADFSDNSYDSAVFLEAGSFNIGVQILDPAGVALPAQIQQCNNEPKVLSASVQSTIGTYQWFLNGTAIPGATTGTYTATQPGIFSVEYTIPGNTCPGTAQVEIIGGTSPAVTNSTLTQCYGAGNVIFNLPLINSSVTSVPGVTFTYYVNQADAIAGNANSIATPTTFSSPGGQTIYASVKGGFCASIAAINLAKAPEMIAVIENPQPITCANPQITLVGNASTYPAGSTFLWQASNGGTIISGGNTINAVVGTAGTYSLTIVKTYQPGNTACTATKTVNVIVDKAPPITTVSAPKTTICNGESITLTATGGANYIWNSSTAIGNTITVSPVVTTTYTVSAVGVNGCQSTAPATITINVVPAITSTLPAITGYICAGDEITLDAGAGPGYTYLWSNYTNNYSKRCRNVHRYH